MQTRHLFRLQNLRPPPTTHSRKNPRNLIINRPKIHNLSRPKNPNPRKPKIFPPKNRRHFRPNSTSITHKIKRIHVLLFQKILRRLQQSLRRQKTINQQRNHRFFHLHPRKILQFQTHSRKTTLPKNN